MPTRFGRDIPLRVVPHAYKGEPNVFLFPRWLGGCTVLNVFSKGGEGLLLDIDGNFWFRSVLFISEFSDYIFEERTHVPKMARSDSSASGEAKAIDQLENSLNPPDDVQQPAPGRHGHPCRTASRSPLETPSYESKSEEASSGCGDICSALIASQPRGNSGAKNSFSLHGFLGSRRERNATCRWQGFTLASRIRL